MMAAINKLLETKKGFVAGAFHKEGLGDIDLVWGNKDYGLEHILQKREKQYTRLGLNADETIKRDNRIISYKQVNGHFVVVEQINRNKSEFIFKTMFKEKI
ncbi:hypothetical protein [Helicobacter pylori]|uniref:putative barnase/colicin E5 family endoribonuclease n=1 Tax=Helicobacter pylori TaxID=210 RepID=UPI001FD6E846|nr:hypothetical protein [Helicobacter pylori]UOR60044.1 hypothetical protein MPG38_04185 [Helicobacter pylori]